MSELDSSTNQSGGSVCPTCGDEFADDHALKTHHGLAHDESIAGVEVECPWCGDTRRVKPSYAEANDNIFCDKSCYGKWLAEKGDAPPNGDGRPHDPVEVQCAWCGDRKMVQPHIKERNKRHFCDPECWARWSEKNRVGEDSPAWRGGKVTVRCAWCEAELKRYPNRAERYSRHFCRGGECLEAWRDEHAHGESYRGPSWKSQREKAIQRDGKECVECGLSQQAHREKYGSDLHVHHKTPFAEYGISNHEEANRLENLVTLCNSCHSHAEAVIQAGGTPDIAR